MALDIVNRYIAVKLLEKMKGISNCYNCMKRPDVGSLIYSTFSDQGFILFV